MSKKEKIELIVWALIGLTANIILFFLLNWKIALAITLMDYSIYNILKKSMALTPSSTGEEKV